MVNHLQDQRSWDSLRAYRVVFYAYAVLGVVKLVLTCALSKAVEVEEKVKPQSAEQDPLLADSTGNGIEAPAKRPGFWTRLLPNISRESRVVVFQISLLFALDSLASGLVPM